MDKKNFLRGFTRVLIDFISVGVGWWFAFLIRPYSDLIPGIHIVPDGTLPESIFYIQFTLLSGIGLIVIFSSLGLYSYPAKYLNFSILWKIFWGLILWILGVLAVYSLLLHDLFFSRMMLAHAVLITLISSLILRGILRGVFEKIFQTQKKILLIGDREEQKFFKKNFAHSEFFLSKSLLPQESLENLETGEAQNFSEIFFFEGEKRALVLQEIREFAAEKGKVLHTIPQYAAEFWGHAQLDIMRGVPVITCTPFMQNPWWYASKRIFDICFSLLFLLLFSPIFLAVAGAIRVNSPGKIFYISERVGRNGKIFHIWKFRSMQENADQLKQVLEKHSHRDGPLFKIKNDPRVTSVGKFLRRTSLDEIPQFFNVLKGDMSVIGPRPHLFSEICKYEASQKRVLSVKPGISGLAQVSGRSDLTFAEEIFLDAFYAENSSFFLDVKIFLKTPFVLLAGKGAD